MHSFGARLHQWGAPLGPRRALGCRACVQGSAPSLGMRPLRSRSAGSGAQHAQRQRQQQQKARRRRGTLEVRAAGASPPPPPPQAGERLSAATPAVNSVSSPAGEVRVGSFLSVQPDAVAAVGEAVAAITGAAAAGAGGGGEPFRPELALVFAAAAYGDGLEEVVPALRQLVPSLRHVFGCTSFGAIGSTPEGPADVEGVGGISITLASLPGTEISVTHTLRSGIPDEDASPEAWSDLVGLAPGASAPTSFLVLADPKFQQTRPLLAGLDFAFPAANKVGGVLSSGQRYKRRAMYAWSADAPVQAGSKRRQQLLRQRRAQADKGFLGSLLSKLKSSFADDSGPATTSGAGSAAQPGNSSSGGPSSSGRGGSSAQAERRAPLAALLGAESADDGDGDDDGWDAGSGLHMYGAAVLGLRGNVSLDPITSQGYRAVSDRIWVVGRVNRDGSVVYSLIDPTAPPDDEDGGEVPPLLALVDLLEAGGVASGGGELSEGEIEELSDDKVWVAIAPDALSADKDIGPDDFQMMKLTDFDENYGAICVDGQVRTGYRLKLVLRDPEGIRADLAARLLRLKREDLAAMLAASARPPAVAALLFVDLERGAALHGEAGYEAGQIGAFLPVPLAGMFAAAEVSTVNRKAALYELATVAAVLRVAPEPEAAVSGVASSSSEEAPGKNEA
ncbi:MAG: FIST N domain-containing protein [Monoraphidium minutum]|nr:MAG: FIST N domain-containing protein [Monoraphidium minutum]